jgi:hypothetical protein
MTEKKERMEKGISSTFCIKLINVKKLLTEAHCKTLDYVNRVGTETKQP